MYRDGGGVPRIGADGVNWSGMRTDLQTVLEYHQQSKHDFHRYAPGPGYLDWANQPDPFRRYTGAPLVGLDRVPPTEIPRYEPAFLEGSLPPAPFDRAFLSQLFFDSLALSAWKQAGENRWALRVNPSSGNLHPTEGYLLSGPVEGVCRTSIVAHYAPREHGLEIRAELPVELWEALTAGLPEPAVLVGLSSIHWRETWKYGLRAYRYCQHDVGHAVGAVAIAAAGMGWRARLLDGLGSEQVLRLLGLWEVPEAETEHPDCLLALSPEAFDGERITLPSAAVDRFGSLEWRGRPNRLSEEHVDWPGIEAVARAAWKPSTTFTTEARRHGEKQGEECEANGDGCAGPHEAGVRSEGLSAGRGFVGVRGTESTRLAGAGGGQGEGAGSLQVEEAVVSLRRIIRQRRSAVDMDGRTGITRGAFYQILLKTLAGPDQVPFRTLTWTPRVHLALFVHRVQDVEPGLYLLVRNPDSLPALRAALRPDFAWEKPRECPEHLGLYRLLTADARSAAQRLSCHQAIAADGCFSLGMLAEFDAPLGEYGPWFYPRLFWECGVIGQVLYLEAEATGVRATGIGCFFDDPVHEVLGVRGTAYQSLYHFTVGGAVDDPRLTTLPAYPL